LKHLNEFYYVGMADFGQNLHLVIG